MGIYINGLKMPGLIHGPITIRIYPTGKCINMCSLWPRDSMPGVTAVPVPEHGRLCNKDDVLKVIDNLIGRTANKEAHEVLKWAKDCLSVLPTIISASKEGE